MAVGIAVIGAGIVGGGVIKTLIGNRDVIAAGAGCDIALSHVCELSRDALTEFNLDGITVTEDAEVMNQDPNVRVVCELIGASSRRKRSF